LIVEYGLGSVALDAITLEVLERNPRARRAYEKSGFTEVETKDEDGERWVVMEIARTAER
jgi:RimJ/RimL family protein N-acetyltransferase